MKTINVVDLMVASAITLGGCNDKTNSKLEVVKVAQANEFFLYMPLYLADAKGFFAEEGLQIEITTTGGDDKTFAAVIGGSADFGVADPTFVAIAKEQGMGGRVIASIVNGVTFWGVTNNPNIQKITNPAQLDGYSVATFPSPNTAYLLQKDMFLKAGLTPNIKQGAFGGLWTMVEAGQADIALELEPNVSTIINNGGKEVYSFAEMYGDFAMTGVAISDEMAAKKPELVQKFVNALQKAMLFAHANPDSVDSYTGKLFPNIDKAVRESAINRIVSANTLPKSVMVSEEAWDSAVKLRQEAGEIKSLEAARGVLDMSFAEKAIENIK